MNIYEFNLNGICIGYDIRILQKWVYTMIIKHGSCNSYIANIMIVQRDSPNRGQHDSDSIYGILVFIKHIYIQYILLFISIYSVLFVVTQQSINQYIS